MILVFAVGVIAYSLLFGSPAAVEESLQPFVLVAYVLSGLALTVTLVLATELAWSTRFTVDRNEEDILFVNGTSTVPVTTFEGMCCHRSSPIYLTRVLMGVANALVFIVLPFQQIRRGTWSSTQWVHWICFLPSILLSIALYGLLIILLQDAETIFDVFFAVVSLQIYAELGNSLVRTIFSRTSSVGSLIETYTVPSSGLPKLVTYTMGTLVDFKGVLIIDLQEQPIYRILTFKDLLDIIVQCVRCYGKDTTIRFVALPTAFEDRDAFNDFLVLVQLLQVQLPHRLRIEVPAMNVGDYEEYEFVQAIGPQV